MIIWRHISSDFSRDPVLEVTLAPNKSLDPQLKHKIFLGVGVVISVAIARFYAIGAWPVSVFLFVDILALWMAFQLFTKRADKRETIRLDHHSLELIQTIAPGQHQKVAMEPYWAKISVEPGRPGGSLQLSSRHHHYIIGHFLNDDERKEVADRMTKELQNWRGNLTHPLRQ